MKIKVIDVTSFANFRRFFPALFKTGWKAVGAIQIYKLDGVVHWTQKFAK